jgi:hypothetical protein
VASLLCCFATIEPPRAWAEASGIGPYTKDTRAGFAALELLLVLVINHDFVLMLLYRGFDDLCRRSQLKIMHR